MIFKAQDIGCLDTTTSWASFNGIAIKIYVFLATLVAYDASKHYLRNRLAYRSNLSEVLTNDKEVAEISHFSNPSLTSIL